MNRTSIVRAAAVVYSLLLFAGGVSADIVLTTRRTTGEYQIMGTTVPASERTTVVMVGSDAIRLDQSPDTSIIIDLTKGTLLVLMHKDKKYTQMSLQSIEEMAKAAMEQEGASAEESQAAMQMMKGIMGAMKFTVTVTETDETKKISSWNCRKFIVKSQIAMSSTETEMWTSTDIKADPALYQKALNSQMLQLAGAAEAVKEWTKLKGIPVLSTTRATVMGTSVTSTEELLKAEEKTLPASTYARRRVISLRSRIGDGVNLST